MNRRNLYWGVAMAAFGLAAALYRMGAGFGCGPYVDIAYFTYTLHPDFPPESYAGGRLGVIQPTYARSYLYVAYRYLSGKKFDPDEQKKLVELWGERLAPFSFGSSQTNAGGKIPSQLWIEARKKVSGAGPGPPITLFREFGKNYQSYFNCTDDGFLTAISTLNERIAKFGADSPVVKEWLSAQDQVFTNCSGKPPGFRPGNENASLAKTIPAALQSGAPPVARTDREYQIAAAYFYSADFDEAAKRFQAIANDKDSPWRQVSRLLVARCLIRKATLSGDIDKFDAAALAQAERNLQEILNDPGMSGIRPSAQRLHNFIEIRLHPVETERLLATRLVQDHVGSSLKQDLSDYTTLLDKLPPAADPRNSKAATMKAEPVPPETDETRGPDDLADWLFSFPNRTPAGLEHSLERWAATRSLPWLAASISKVRAGQAPVPLLLKAAEAIPPESPAFATIEFHRLRLLSEARQNDEVRISLDKLISEQGKSLPLSALNLFLALRMKVATNLEEMLKFAQRVPATVTLDEEGMELPDAAYVSADLNKSREKKTILFDADSTIILNRMLPLEFLAKAAQSKSLSEDLRMQIARAVWVRAILLGDAAEAQEITPVWQSLDSGIKNDLETYRAEKSADGARFAAVYFMLKFPGTRPIVDTGVSRETPLNKIDSLRDNWWCLPESAPSKAAAAGTLPMSGPLQSIYPDRQPSPPAFLSPEQRAKGEDDWKKLPRVPANYFAREVLAWGKEHPDDPREAEALYLVVRATHYGCVDGATAGLSKAAFKLLHAQYPKTEWARKTKYWYGSTTGGM